MLTQQSTAAALLMRYRNVRAATMRFCAPLTPEDMMVQSCAEASPVKWHLAHTSWFFETFVLAEFVANYKPFHPNFRWLFNSYYNALGDMPEKKLRASFSRPPLDQILAYREHVDVRLCRLLEQTPEDEVLRRVVLDQRIAGEDCSAAGVGQLHTAQPRHRRDRHHSRPRRD
jgi:hypothetical protein